MDLPNGVQGYLAVEECDGDRCRFIDESVTVTDSWIIDEKQVFRLADENGNHLLDRKSGSFGRFVLLNPIEKPGDVIEFISFKDDGAAGSVRRRRTAKRGKKYGKKHGKKHGKKPGKKSRVRGKKQLIGRGRKRRTASRRGACSRARGGRTRRR
jgi:hypothetical protein